ncbi:MAG: hypothetical protein IJ942_01765 [Alistipes sp.]|nr:hypothetical protein [Alistipes sp.]
MSRTYIEVTYIDPNVCFECGAPATERHHIVPASLGGSKTVPLCGICHAKIHDVDGKRRTRIAELTKAALDAKKARGETWVRNTDTTAARAVSCRMRVAARENWMKESVVGKYVLAKWMEGLTFTDILHDLDEMYAINPDVYCSRNGVQIARGTLSKMISFYKEWQKDYVPQNKIRFLLQWAQKANKPFNLQLSCNFEKTISSNDEKGYILHPTGSFIKEYELKYWEEFFQLLRSFYIIKERYDSDGKVYYVFASDTMIIRLVKADIESTPIDKNVLKKIGMGL